MFATGVSEKTTIELDDALEENYMTVYMKTINGKTISIKCNKKQKAATFSDEVERRSSTPRGMTYLVHQAKVMNEKRTIEENNIGAETAIEMSRRLLGGMVESDMKDTSETEEEREKKRKVEETSKSKSMRTSEEPVFLQREIIDAIRKSEEKTEIYQRSTHDKISEDNHGFSRNTAPWYELNHCENERRRRQIQANR